MTTLSKYETFTKRLLAGIVDGLVFIPFVFFDSYFHNTETSNYVFIGWTLFYMVSWSLYSIIGHGKFGQTVGKKVMHIKVLDLNEVNVIGYKRAFLRDSFWIIANVIIVAYFLIVKTNNFEEDIILRTTLFDSYMSLITLVWFILEMVTMFFNDKRRAIHDFLAGSVVLDLRTLRKEELNKRHDDLVRSLR